MPVRVGVPKYFGGLAGAVKNPRFSTAVGLLTLGKDQIHRPSPVEKNENGSVGHLFSKMKAWFAGNF